MPFPSFTDGPPPPERGRATALACVVLLLGVAALLTGLGPYLRVQTSSGTVTLSGFVTPQGLMVVACLLFSGLVAGLSTLPRLTHLRGATPVLHAVSTASATVGALLALFLLIVVSNAAQLSENLLTGTDSTMVAGLGWAGVTILALAVVQALTAFAALAFDVGLAQARRTPLAPAPAGEPAPVEDSPSPARRRDATAARTAAEPAPDGKLAGAATTDRQPDRTPAASPDRDGTRAGRPETKAETA